jgi:uncharacterized protein involved in exopolysaccharide biosynthesis
MAPSQDGLPPEGAREAELVDFAEIRRLLGLVTGAIRRHLPLFLTVFMSFIAATAALVVVLPRSYHTRCKILAQRNLVMPALGNPKRAVPIDSDTPTRAVSETILSHDSLVLLIKQLNLLDQWETSRAPILRLKDYLLDKIRGPLDDKDRLEALTGFLEKRLSVTTENETVTIEVEWPNAAMAEQLVDTAEKNFLAERHQTEVSTIAETIAILEGHATSLRQTIESSVDEIEKEKSLKSKVEDSTVVPRAVAQLPRPNRQLSDLKEQLEATRRAIAAMSEARNLELSQAQARLDEQKTIYAPANPLILAAEEHLASMGVEPPQLRILRTSEQHLALEYQEAGAQSEAPHAAGLRRSKRRLASKDPANDMEEEEEEEEDDYPKVQLKTASDDYEDLLRRIEGARIELETTQAAFKYRYRLVLPGEVPKKPTSPNVPVVLSAGLFLGLLGSIFAALLADLRGGVLRESWQVEQRLKIAVLGEIKLS